MLFFRRRVSLFLLSPPTEPNGFVYYAIHTSEFRRTSSEKIIPWSIIIILETKPRVIKSGMIIFQGSNTFKSYCQPCYFWRITICWSSTPRIKILILGKKSFVKNSKHSKIGSCFTHPWKFSVNSIIILRNYLKGYYVLFMH